VIIPRDPKADKDELAREMAAKHGVKSGPVCAISALEPSPAFEHRGTHIQPRVNKGHSGSQKGGGYEQISSGRDCISRNTLDRAPASSVSAAR
jgi:hypothetical protein